jgi:hypothetical protein
MAAYTAIFELVSKMLGLRTKATILTVDDLFDRSVELGRKSCRRFCKELVSGLDRRSKTPQGEV